MMCVIHSSDALLGLRHIDCDKCSKFCTGCDGVNPFCMTAAEKKADL